MAATESEAGQPPVEDVLSREAEQAPRAGYAALAAAVLIAATAIASQLVYADIPRIPLIDALRDVAGQGIGRQGLLTDKLRWYDDHAAATLLLSVLPGLGALCTAYVLLFLHRATTDRGGTVPRLARLGVMFGAACIALGALGAQIAVTIQAHRYVTGGDLSTAAAHDALRSGPILVGQALVLFVGPLVLAVSFVLISLNAMRVGLLTRFLGILGVLVGVLLIVPLGSSVPVVELFWLAAVGILLLGRWPSGTPAAWQTGRAVAWPTQQELREARERAAGRTPDAGSSDVETTPEETPRSGEPSPAASRKKKRKRRG